MILDGQAVAAEHRRALAARSQQPLTLGMIVATGDSATAAYISRKQQAAGQLGWRTVVKRLPATAGTADLVAACQAMNADTQITGYIVQLPLPQAVNRVAVFAAIDPVKDADGLSPANLQRLSTAEPGIVPATARGILSLLRHYDLAVDTRRVTVVGQGWAVGAPIAVMLQQAGGIVDRCDKKTNNLVVHTKAADILVSAVGQPGLITAGMVKPGAAVIDVGTTRVAGRITGDVDFAAVSRVAGAITPVPGGVGPMTVVSLLENVFDLSQAKK